jgi:iron complex transport system substrate-binding protein
MSIRNIQTFCWLMFCLIIFSLHPAYALEKKLANTSPARIVSLAPSLTESLFAIGAGPAVKGVSAFCEYPDQAKKLLKVGGIYDLSFEAIADIQPDLILCLPEHREYLIRLKQLNFNTLTIPQESWVEVMASFIWLGQICRQEYPAARLFNRFASANRFYISKTNGWPRKKVLLVVQREYSVGDIQDVYIAGQGAFLNDLLRMLGAENAYSQTVPVYPKISAEGILALQPDIVIEFLPTALAGVYNIQKAEQAWRKLLAIQNPKFVYKGLTGNVYTIPGPRLLQVIREVAQILYPEESWPIY